MLYKEPLKSAGLLAGSSEAIELQNSITGNLATVLSASGMTVDPSAIVITSIGGGSVVIDYSVTVAPELASPENREAAILADNERSRAGNACLLCMCACCTPWVG